MTAWQRSARIVALVGSGLAAASAVTPVSAQGTKPSDAAKPAFIDERRLPGASRDIEERQRAAEDEKRRTADELRKRLEAEAATLREQLEAAAVEQRKRVEAEAEALRQRLAAEEEARQRAAAEAAEAARRAEAERQAKAEEEARQRAASEAAEAARKAEAERQAKAEEEARRKAPGASGNPADAARYLARGQEHLGRGDFASGRLFLERASDSGSADAALLLAETYDAATQQRLGGIGIAADAKLARRWYQRAAELGSAVAAERLKQLGGQ